MTERTERSDRPDNFGSCLCEAVKFKLYGKPLQCAVCHCDSCQQFSGSAFMVNCWYRKEVWYSFKYLFILLIAILLT